MPTRSPRLPACADVVVIGAGIVGTATAYYLARRGLGVALCEKGRVAGEQSSRNWGFVRQQGRDPAEIPLAIESLRLWRGIEQDIGEPVGFHQGGILYVADSDEEMARYEAWLEHARQHQLDTRLLSVEEAKAMVPGAVGRRWRGALYTPSDAHAEPRLATPALARAAASLGAAVLTECAVRSLLTEAGRVAGVITEHGEIRAPSVVLAGGAWSALLCRNLGVDLPQLRVRASALRTAPAPSVTEGAVWTRQAALRRRQDGGYTVAHGAFVEHFVVPDSFRYLRLFRESMKAERGRLRVRLDSSFFAELTAPKRWRDDQPTPFERTRVLDPSPNERVLAEAMAELGAQFPDLRGVEVAERWAGLIDVTPDAIPVISELDALPGFYLSTGYSGHGFGIGLGAGRATAELVAGGPVAVDLTPFRFNRFREGAVEPGPAGAA